MNRKFTVWIVRDGKKVLLGMKKRKIGVRYWMGFGDNVKNNETWGACALRKLEAEAGLVANEAAFCGALQASFEELSDIYEIQCFIVDNFAGEATESDEMKPRWFPVENIPFNKIWASDSIWWPMMLAGKRFRLDAVFDNLISRKLLEWSMIET